MAHVSNDSISILPSTDFVCFTIVTMLPLDTYFLINWLDDPEDDIYDVVNSKLVVPPDDVDILSHTRNNF